MFSEFSEAFAINLTSNLALPNARASSLMCEK
jgi:hypothetical protein